jgi:hypothetical protein
MSVLLFLKSLFLAPQRAFNAGDRVNHIRGGSVRRTDGYVVAQTAAGVLVEWPRGGSSLLPNTELSQIG